jgi:hypothetical protein
MRGQDFELPVHVDSNDCLIQAARSSLETLWTLGYILLVPIGHINLSNLSNPTVLRLPISVEQVPSWVAQSPTLLLSWLSSPQA